MSVQNAVPLVCLLVSSLVAVASFVFSFRCIRPSAPQMPLEGDAERAFRWRSALACAFTLAILFAVTRPQRDPFSAGQGLGIGLLLSGMFSMVSCWLRLEFQSRLARSFMEAAADARSSGLQVLHLSGKFAAGELGLAVAPIAAVLWQIRDDPTSALMGCAIGALAVRILVGFSSQGLNRSGLTDEVLGVFSVALAVASTLAVMHDLATTRTASLAQQHMLWMLPLLAATMMTVIAMFTNRFISTGGLESTFTGIALVAGSSVALNLGAMTYLSLGVYRTRAVLLPLASGALLSLLACAFIASAQSNRARNGALGFVVAGLVLGVWAESFRRLAGYGVALTSLGALSMSGLTVALSLAAASPFGPSAERATGWAQLAQRTTMVAGLLVSVSLARIFLTNVPMRAADMSVFSHYLLLGLTVGLVAPLLLLTARTGTYDPAPAPGRRMTRELLAAGAIGLSIFFIVVLTPLFFRIRSSAGLIVGLVIAHAVLLFVAFSGQFVAKSPPGRWTLPPITLFTLGGGVLGAQLGPLLASNSGLLQRPHKLALTAALLLAAFMWFVSSGHSNDSASSAGDRQ